jgi:hypothetical protein
MARNSTEWGSPFNRSTIGERPLLEPASTTRGRWASSKPGSVPMRTALITWSGCAGQLDSSARAVATREAGGSASCSRRTSVTAGTIFDRTRTPLTVWFTTCWMFATQKDGVSALSLQRALEIGSYQTAWAMLHRLRSVLVRPGRDRLAGTVEVDETFIGGEEAGLPRRSRGKKTLTGIAVEVQEPKGIGRCRMAILRDATAVSLLPFVIDHVEPGARVITDGWQGYAGLGDHGYVRERRSQRVAQARGEDPVLGRAGSARRRRPDQRCRRPPAAGPRSWAAIRR